MANKNDPVQTAKIVLSGQGLRARVDQAEQAALGVTPAKKKKKPAVAAPTTTLPAGYQVPQRYQDQRAAAIEAQRQADLAAIEQMRQKKGLRR